MPTLLELQKALRTFLVEHDPAVIAGALRDGVPPTLLDVYRNTVLSGLTKALRLAYPAIERLVGGEFFDGMAQAFITEHLPRAAYLDQYGDQFPDFLSRFPPAASLSYLAHVAKLEWAVNCALHAPDIDPLDLTQLAEITPQRQGTVRFRPHPSASLIRAGYPVDDIWRAVLSRDDQTLADLDLSVGPVFLLVERSKSGIEVSRLRQSAWFFLAALCRDEPLQSAVASSTDLDIAAALAEHLAAGRFASFSLDAHREGHLRSAPA